MRVFKSLFLFCLPFATAVLAQEQPASHNIPRELNEAFQELLDLLPEESIQDALHKHFQHKFKAGVFQFNRKAVEAVHSTNAPLATKLVIDAAKHGLIRRQNNGTTTRPTSSSSPTMTLPFTTTDSSVRTTTQSTTSPGGVVETKTDSRGSTFVTTTPVPTAEETTSIGVEQTTLPNGDVVLVTRTVIGKITPTNGPGATNSQTHSPGLQNAASRSTGFAAGAAVVAAAGTFFGAMLI